MRRLHPDEKMDLPLNSVSLRVYADSRPHMLQTAKLQKGVVLVYNGTELVGEGLGIGVPVCRYQDGTRFSMSAETFIDNSAVHPKIVKTYDMNGIAAKRFREVSIRRGRYLAHLLRLLEKAYRKFRRFTVGAGLVLELLSFLGMRNEYVKSHSKGRIIVTYRPNGAGLHIEADLGELTADGLQSVIFANEQSGRLFNEYADSSGARLQGTEIEPWWITRAEWASLHCRELGLGLRLHRPNGWRIVRGREVVEERISWSGLDLVYGGVPKTLEYRVQFA